MTVGFDWYATITEYPAIMAGFSQVLRDAYCRVVVITAVFDEKDEEEYQARVAKHLEEIGFYYDKIVVVPFHDPKIIPELKLIQCRVESVTHYFDDRQDVVDMLNLNNILGMRVRKTAQKGVKHENKTTE